ncbi:MAG: hypothetical protein JOZ07_17205 [Solirubrobacterales bacterium]|nr:hypothetical protein [Solirubrobacterales bacterium]
MSAVRREAIADRLLVVAAVLLFGSLFLTWSHQLSAAVLARYGHGPALAGVPRSPDAWQVYSAADVLLALLAAGMLAGALWGARTPRLVLAGALLVAVAFVVHALGTPPTNGATLFAPPAPVRDAPTAGVGEAVALAACLLGLGGLLLSVTVER